MLAPRSARSTGTGTWERSARRPRSCCTVSRSGTWERHAQHPRSCCTVSRPAAECARPLLQIEHAMLVARMVRNVMSWRRAAFNPPNGSLLSRPAETIRGDHHGDDASPRRGGRARRRLAATSPSGDLNACYVPPPGGLARRYAAAARPNSDLHPPSTGARRPLSSPFSCFDRPKRKQPACHSRGPAAKSRTQRNRRASEDFAQLEPGSCRYLFMSLLEAVSATIRRMRSSPRTEEAYLHWIRAYVVLSPPASEGTGFANIIGDQGPVLGCSGLRRVGRVAHRLGGGWCRFWHHPTSGMLGVWGRQAPSEALAVRRCSSRPANKGTTPTEWELHQLGLAALPA